MSRASLRSCLQSRVTWGMALTVSILAARWFATSLALESITQLHNGHGLVSALKLICAVVIWIAAAGTTALALLFTFCVKSFED